MKLQLVKVVLAGAVVVAPVVIYAIRRRAAEYEYEYGLLAGSSASGGGSK